jgi:hypothetical protein
MNPLIKLLMTGLVLLFSIPSVAIPSIERSSLERPSLAKMQSPTNAPELKYPSLTQGQYTADITPPRDVLGYPVGQRVAAPEQIAELMQIWAKQSKNLQLIKYARSHEGRPLYYAIISSEKNLANLSKIKSDITRLSNPAKLSKAQTKSLINDLPATAWLAYSIHGNETSGADASLAVIYRLIASEEPLIKQYLNDMVLFVDPAMNPDGRARFWKVAQQSRGVAPNVDDQASLHRGEWPYGRGNHYLFDLNRDFIYLTQPETRGRVKAINQWRPQLYIDGHEMGAQGTFLFSPPREPINSNYPNPIKKWGETFAHEQAQAFDKRGWTYYTGEWFEDLYAGYSFYSAYRGSIPILYEQARIAEDGIKHADGTTITYKESVDHQLASTFANLATLHKNTKSIYKDYVKVRKAQMSKDSEYADRYWAIPPFENKDRLNELLISLGIHDIEILQTTKESSISNAKSQLGIVGKVKLPKGTLIINNLQAESRLAAAMLEFDTKISTAILQEERQKKLRNGSSVMYDVTAWNLTMMYGIPAYEVNQSLSLATKPYQPSQHKSSQTTKPKLSSDNAIAVIVDGARDRSVGFAARLVEQGVRVKVIDKKAVLDRNEYARGSVVVIKSENKHIGPKLETLIQKELDAANLNASTIKFGLGSGDNIDIGGGHFIDIAKPSVALVGGPNMDSLTYGAIWYTIDKYLGIRISKLNHLNIRYSDLRRYNVIILPTNYAGFSDATIAALAKWTEQGGSLIAIGGAAAQMTKGDNALSQVQTLHQSLDKAESFNLALHREWLAHQGSDFTKKDLWSNSLPTKLETPWDNLGDLASTEKLKKVEKWQRIFSPSGVIIAGRTDQKHYLTFGSDLSIPLLYSGRTVLMSDTRTDAVVRMGAYTPSKKAKSSTVNWYTTPNGQVLNLRMSGLLWPEAAQRIANSAYLTNERKGLGQVILFANNPNFRGAGLTSARMLLNAIVYGPGLGTVRKIDL